MEIRVAERQWQRGTLVPYIIMHSLYALCAEEHIKGEEGLYCDYVYYSGEMHQIDQSCEDETA
jgi:hypothetical protein